MPTNTLVLQKSHNAIMAIFAAYTMRRNSDCLALTKLLAAGAAGFIVFCLSIHVKIIEAQSYIVR
jgi:hypothetical protein